MRQKDSTAATINVGDIVEWKSQAFGSETIKRGTVIYIVEENAHISAALYSMERKGIISNRKQVKIQFDLASFPRDHKSYIVLVQSGDKKRPCLYFPRVRGLKVVKVSSPSKS